MKDLTKLTTKQLKDAINLAEVNLLTIKPEYRNEVAEQTAKMRMELIKRVGIKKGLSKIGK